METIIISGDKSKVDLIQKLAKELGLDSKRVDKLLTEDPALGMLANMVKTGKTVSKATVLKKA